MSAKPWSAGCCPVLFAYRIDRKTCRICVPKRITSLKKSTANVSLRPRVVQNVTAPLKKTDGIASCTKPGEKSNENKGMKKPRERYSQGFLLLAIRTRLELATPSVTGLYSNQLNYRTSFLSGVQM